MPLSRVLLAVLAVAAPAVGTPSAAAAPAQGIYDQCAPGAVADHCASRLQTMAAGGFTVVVNYGALDGDPAAILAFADAAAAAGVRVVWPLIAAAWRDEDDPRARFPALARACGCDRRDALVAYVTHLVGGHPATWGWYVGDELGAEQHASALALRGLVRDRDPAHPSLYVGYDSTRLAGTALAGFSDVADVIGVATYPFGNAPAPLAEVSQMTQTLRDRVTAPRRRAAVLQAFDWNDHRAENPGAAGGFPTREQLMEQLRIVRGVEDLELVLWYAYPDIMRGPDGAARWADLTAAVRSSPRPASTVRRARKPRAAARRAARQRRRPTSQPARRAAAAGAPGRWPWAAGAAPPGPRPGQRPR